MTITYKTNVATTDLTVPFAERDEYLTGTNGGVHVFDLARAYSYPKQAAPANNDVVHDLCRAAAGAADGYVRVEPGDALPFSGNGLDFATATARSNGVVFPGAPLAGLWTNQQFLICIYVKLPAGANWVTGTSKFVGLLKTTDRADPNSDPTPIDMLMVSTTAGDVTTGRRVWVRRQKSSGTDWDTLSFAQTDVPFGEIAQIAAWRTGGVFFARIKSASKNVTYSTAAAALSTNNFSAKLLQAGRCGASTDLAQTTPHRIYRGMTEDLFTTGRNPVTVLDADYTRTIARGVFS